MPIHKEQEIGWKEAFYLCDEDGDGYLTYSEATTLLRSLGLPLTTQDVNSIISSITNSHRLSLSNMEKVISLCNNSNITGFRDQLRASLLSIMDDNTDRIHIDCLASKLLAVDSTLTEKDLMSVLKKCRMDKNQYINVEDLVNVLSG